MNINKNNYEAFFLDYHEGNLTPQQVADLLLYIEQHPELREEFESFENIILEDFSDITFENKSGLKKEITIDNKDEFFIRSIENTLTPAEKALVTDFIKQHPQYATDFELFQKTKLVADASIVFENKNSLKRVAVSAPSLTGEAWGEVMIASIEGLLTSSETALLNQQVAVDSEMQHNLHFYQQTKLVADTSIVYEDKEELKRKERRAIPLFYYVAVAASLLFLFGLYFMFNNHSDEQKFANVIHPKINKQEVSPKEKQVASVKEKQEASPPAGRAGIKYQEKNLAQVPVSNNSATKKAINKKDSPIVPVTNNELPIVNNQAPVNNEQPIANNTLPQTNSSAAASAKEDNKQPATNNQQPINSSQSLALNDKTNAASDFLTFRELAVEKLKEKTLDKNTVASQKKNGRLRRFSGWDFAQIVTKGISKITGRNLEVKPTYNNDGVVTAYALGDGIERTTGR